jgi:hypothetical protein
MQGGQPFRMEPQMFHNHKGRFTDVSATAGDWFREAWLGRGVASADFNQDGKLDIVTSCQLAPAAILINETPFLGSRNQTVGTFHYCSGNQRHSHTLGIDEDLTDLTTTLHSGESFQVGLRSRTSSCTQIRTRLSLVAVSLSGAKSNLKTRGGHYFFL